MIVLLSMLRGYLILPLMLKEEHRLIVIKTSRIRELVQLYRSKRKSKAEQMKKKYKQNDPQPCS